MSGSSPEQVPAFISLLALVWMILLSVVAFAWWDILAQPEREWHLSYILILVN
jgi:hypothetical protein